MKKPLVVKAEVFARLAGLPAAERAECWNALFQLTEVFGRPHVHAGIGIRKLGRNLFECRGNRSLRYLFMNFDDCLEVRFLGDHDEIRRQLRS